MRLHASDVSRIGLEFRLMNCGEKKETEMYVNKHVLKLTIHPPHMNI